MNETINKIYSDDFAKALKEAFSSVEFKGEFEEISKKEVDSAYIIKIKITNESVDRDGEIIKADGIDWKYFDTNPVILIDHSYKVGSIAGKAIKREVKRGETFLTVQLAKGTEAGELIKTLYDQGMIKGVSIGFLPLELDVLNNSIITKSEALEASFVAVGSNREALVQDSKLFEKCVKFGLIKLTTQIVNSASEVFAGDVITWRRLEKYTQDNIQKIDVWPSKSKLPYMGRILAKFENNEEIIRSYSSTEILIATAENPFFVIQKHVISINGPKNMTDDVCFVSWDSIQVEKIIPETEVKTFKEFYQEDEDGIKSLIIQLSDKVEALEKAVSTGSFALDGADEKEEALKKAAALGAIAAGSLSAFLCEAKKV